MYAPELSRRCVGACGQSGIMRESTCAPMERQSGVEPPHSTRNVSFLVQLSRECNRELLGHQCCRRTVGGGVIVAAEELTGGKGGATPVVCEPSPSFCKVFA